MQYNWINIIANILYNYTSIYFNNIFNQKMEQNNLPENLTYLTFGKKFNKKIELNTLSKNITYLTFGDNFNQKIEPNTLPENLTCLTFGKKFNQKIEPNILPDKLSSITFGFDFDQNIENIITGIENISFDWTSMYHQNIEVTKINIVNNIPKYYNVKIYLNWNTFSNDLSKWPLHVINYHEDEWPSEIYKIIDNYVDPIYDNIVVLINRKSYEPYSFAKSAKY